MAKRKRRRDDPTYRIPGYDDLADRTRDTGPANRNRVVVAESRALPKVDAGHGRAKLDEKPTFANYAYDPILWMLNRGTISKRLAEAGVRFRQSFSNASASIVPAIDWTAPMVQSGGPALYPAGAAAPASWRLQVQPALDALGDVEHPSRRVAWYVLGLGLSLRAFAETKGWGGVRPRDPSQASGVLTCALTTLADHYGLEN